LIPFLTFLTLTKSATLILTLDVDPAMAAQGPSAAAVLQDLVKLDLSTIFFGNFVKAEIAGAPSFITRTGCATPAAGAVETQGLAPHRAQFCGLQENWEPPSAS
jgi:hypothetical protein